MKSTRALVDVDTGDPVTLETIGTHTFETTGDVLAARIVSAIVDPKTALVDVRTGPPIAVEPIQAGAFESAV